MRTPTLDEMRETYEEAGLAAVELAHAIGAKVIAAASTDEKLEVCREHGALPAYRLFFDRIEAQDEATATALTGFGVEPHRVHLAGSFKGAAPALPCDAAELYRKPACIAVSQFSYYPYEERHAQAEQHAAAKQGPERYRTFCGGRP